MKNEAYMYASLDLPHILCVCLVLETINNTRSVLLEKEKKECPRRHDV